MKNIIFLLLFPLLVFGQKETIMTTQEDVKEIKKTLEKIEDKLYK